MGNDGGSIPKRSELVKEKKKDPVADARIQTIARSFYCALSKALLQTPVVADLLGTMYNREAILEMLLDRSRYGDSDVICPHIHSLKDVVTLKLTPNPATSEKPKEPADSENNKHGHDLSKQYNHSNGTTVMGSDETAPQALFVCPITKREMNGRYRFVFSRQCGCVVSEQAIREIEEPNCLVCNKPASPEDYIPINPDAEQLTKLKAALESKKKTKKAKRKKNHDDDANTAEKRSRIDASSPSSSSTTTRTSSKAASIIEQHRQTTVAQRSMPKAVKELFTSTKKDDASSSSNGKNLFFHGTFTRYA